MERDYYKDGRKYEPVDVINDWDLDFCLGNVVKYISRAGRKTTDKAGVLDDLLKASDYLNYEIGKITIDLSPSESKNMPDKVYEALKRKEFLEGFLDDGREDGEQKT